MDLALKARRDVLLHVDAERDVFARCTAWANTQKVHLAYINCASADIEAELSKITEEAIPRTILYLDQYNCVKNLKASARLFSAIFEKSCGQIFSIAVVGINSGGIPISDSEASKFWINDYLIENKYRKMDNTATILEAKATEADFDSIINQLKTDLLNEISPTPIVEIGEFYGDFKDIYLSWDNCDGNNFHIAEKTVLDWVNKHADRYPGFELNFLDPIGWFADDFVTINVYRK